MNWVEIPAHRVLEIDRNELINEFDIYDQAGTLCGSGKVSFLFRKRDGKRFKFAQFGDLHGAVKMNRVYLQEV
jgi:hypothetical protein